MSEPNPEMNFIDMLCQLSDLRSKPAPEVVSSDSIYRVATEIVVGNVYLTQLSEEVIHIQFTKLEDDFYTIKILGWRNLEYKEEFKSIQTKLKLWFFYEKVANVA